MFSVVGVGVLSCSSDEGVLSGLQARVGVGNIVGGEHYCNNNKGEGIFQVCTTFLLCLNLLW